MAARLGQVIYWAASLVSGLLGIGGIVMSFFSTVEDHVFLAIIFCFFPAAVIWLIGRGIKFILAGN
jgi:hypothetical protein